MIKDQIVSFFKRQSEVLTAGGFQPAFIVKNAFEREAQADIFQNEEFQEPETEPVDVIFQLTDNGIKNSETDYVISFETVARDLAQRNIGNDMTFNDQLSSYLTEIAVERKCYA